MVRFEIDGVAQPLTDEPPPASRSKTPTLRREIRPEPWPLLLSPIKLLAKEGDRGAGDIIARTVGPIGGEAFKAWYKKLFGKDCGCGHRQEVLNARWPLSANLTTRP